MSTILLGGASGFIGRRLADALRARGDRVVALSRRAGGDGVHWDPAGGRVDEAALAQLSPDAVINLAGEPIAQRWTEARRRRIHDSRVRGSAALAAALARLPSAPRVYVGGSGMNYYGADRGDEELTEAGSAGTGFLASVTSAWEHAAIAAQGGGTRVVVLRTSTVLGSGGGALGPLLPAFRFGLGGPVGSGRQWFSWIALEDAVRAIVFLVDRADASGAYNLASPEPVRYAAFARTLAAVLHRPAMFPAPAAVLRLVFGQMAVETILANLRIVPARLNAAGFEFRHPRLEDALRSELSR